MMDFRRIYLIARRDYLGYIRTWGFWLSFILPFLFGALGVFFSLKQPNVTPIRYETILDRTGQHETAILETHRRQFSHRYRQILENLDGPFLDSDTHKAVLKIFDEKGVEAALEFLNSKSPDIGAAIKLPKERRIFVKAPSTDIEELKTYLKGEKTIIVKEKNVKLDGVLYIRRDKNLKVEYWSPHINNNYVPGLTQDYFKDLAASQYLNTGDLTLEGLEKAKRRSINIQNFDPTKAATGEADSQAVTLKDRIPFIVASMLASFLWLTIFSASYMLLTSMLEEKLNKLMEMMLASVRFSEVMFGKLAGIAALTITAMLPYIAFGLVSIFAIIFGGLGGGAQALLDAFTPKLLIFFPIYLILGYVFYGALFIGVGSLAESSQDAQTLTTPIILILTACILVVPLGISAPDSPILHFASWFPISAPFAAIVRLPSDPPWWELTLSALFLGVLSIIVIWGAGRLFRYGLLSGGGIKGVKKWIGRVIFRRKTV